ncbi:hypothetical protein E2C01_064113 [Portunus trituberculatus]|uniref:Uncharacterized protein n=1 Tax=Portunus trituberculatus TaxID=210409 RepID=A0A5B7HAV0_PORTR|nr:hypothetical protein [Portunus trituberculatus]
MSHQVQMSPVSVHLQMRNPCQTHDLFIPTRSFPQGQLRNTDTLNETLFIINFTCTGHTQSQTQTGQRNNLQSDKQIRTAAVYRTRSESGGRLPATVASATLTQSQYISSQVVHDWTRILLCITLCGTLLALHFPRLVNEEELDVLQDQCRMQKH